MAEFDVFLAHNSLDKPQIIEIAQHLKQIGLKPWLDKEQILGGDTILEKVFNGIKQSKTGAFFISSNGLGNFQENIELYTVINWFLRQQGKSQSFRVIPILLPGVTNVPEKIEYLAIWRWIQFTKTNDEEALDDLIRSIRGRETQVKAQPIIQSPETPSIIPPQSPTTIPKPETDDLASEKGIDYTRLVQLQAEASLLVSDIRKYIRGKREQEAAFRIPKMIKSSSAETGEEFYRLADETLEGLMQLSDTIDTDWIVIFRGRAKQIRQQLISQLNEYNKCSKRDFFEIEPLYNAPKTSINIGLIADEIESISNEIAYYTKDIASEKGINYTKLRDLLAAKNWKEADKETYLVMIKAVDKKDGDYFTSDELLNFPCTDLRTIDRLWVKYSNGHFGFSVQKEIYLSVGGKADGLYRKEAWEKFSDRVGWRVKSSWIYYGDVETFDTSSPKGHLPFWVQGEVGRRAGGVGVKRCVVGVSSLASRLVNCNI